MEVVKATKTEIMNFDLYSEGDKFVHNNEIYSYVSKHKTYGDGEWTDYICKRESDNKYFKYSIGYDGGTYYYEPNLYEEVGQLR